ncbi:monofunctional biosynthetic peptidoglycan transglycosylase [Novosphingobium sp. JCM 18896]|uniref:monofunctional biosynthetic peptidoglycan transglycosylase n=1 Tax=Novosphingobium sp. JCM 18896 TaxID=2989731 RepID=UPI0022225FEA|nr:monofunctional biosynthetic peptidoglycan transglycosylase [Novosphingobium sp. JCM 18896]MCW1427700.1 monofunctional biosynthetic peptidoglycan transglycosylase [Novosphingobium sp. JCM 18896]
MVSIFKRSTSRSERGFAYRLGWWIGRAIVWFLAISVGLTIVYRFVPPPVTLTMLLDPNGFEKDWEPLSRIDRDMVAAVIAGEDGKFCTHNGFDRAAIEQAMERNAKGGRIRGGSTISQQTAKNVFLWQGTGWTRYLRKGFETWFTFLIETIWGKRRIMEVYLNVAETGIGTYGVEAGAQRYYRHSAAKLSPVEAARIAAALPSPKRRAVTNATGFTRRHGNTIARRSGVVRNSAFDSCVYD